MRGEAIRFTEVVTILKQLFRPTSIWRYIVFAIMSVWLSATQAELPQKPAYTAEYKKLINKAADGVPSRHTKINRKDSQSRPAGKRQNRILRVGPGKEFILPSIAAEFANDGDTIEIYADGDYTGDEVVWRQNNIQISGVAGKPHIKGNGLIKNRKALWVITGSNVLVENIEFSNARVKDRNGAAIRNSGKHLRIVNCYLHHNENGILAGSGKDTVVEIEGSEFSYNGYGRGKTHNIYIGRIARFLLTNSYIHHAFIGHNIKSRAKKNLILYNKIIDGSDGRSSYAIDLSNGGEAYIIGNIIQQGKNTENSSIVSYAAEGFRYPNKSIYLVNNTLVNDRHYGIFIKARRGSKVTLINNIFYGKGRLGVEPDKAVANVMVKNQDIFADSEKFDFRPKRSKLIVDKGVNPGKLDGLDLTPAYQYRHPMQLEKRAIKNRIDIGAYEYH